ncbi:MAG: LCP family protein [Clostridia bacterium]|nr:LCP family protein [Clostridia bacterium]
MDENKYQVIDPDSEKYKLTAKDILDDSKAKKKKKRKKRILVAFISLFLVFAIVFGTGAVIFNNYLNKMNFGDATGEVDPSIEAEESLEFENQADADADIRANLDDNVLWYDDRIYNILLVGADYGDRKDGKFDNYLTRSDSMILLSINTINNVINMVSLSRAAYVAIPGHGNKRLNAAHAYGGAKLLVETIEQNYKIRIDKYVTVNFDGFQSIVDALNGVSVNLTAQEASIIVGKAKAGTYNLNGEKAMAFARLRSIDSDRKRTGRQRAILNAMAVKLRQSSVSQLFDLLDVFLPLVTTNFTKTELIGQMANVPQYLKMSIHEDVIPFNALPLSLRGGVEVLILDWEETHKRTHDLLYPGIVPQSAQE